MRSSRVDADSLGTRRTELSAARKLPFWIAPTVAAFGPLLPLVGPFYSFRILALTVGIIGFALPQARDSVASLEMGRVFSFASAVWVFGGLAALITMTNQDAGYGEMLSIVCGLAFVAGVSRLASASDALHWLSQGWILAFVITGFQATGELLTGEHLSNYGIDVASSSIAGGQLVASTFGNPNGYGLFLATGVPVVCRLINQSSGPLVRAAYAGVLLWLLVLLTATGSRLCLAAAALAILVWVASTRGKRVWQGALLLGVLFVILSSTDTWRRFSGLLPEEILDFSGDDIQLDPEQGLNSGSVRINLIRNGLDAVWASGGLGVGPGNFGSWLEMRADRHHVGGTFSPHNAFIELLAQYGVIVTLVVGFSLGAALRFARQRQPSLRGATSGASTIVRGLAITFPLYGAANSSFWDNPSTWITMAIFLTACASVGQAQKRSDSRPERTGALRRGREVRVGGRR